MESPDSGQLAIVFRNVDKDKDGEIDGKELQSALSNGTWLPFNPETVKLMIKMFDRRGNSKICFQEFGDLWNYVQQWQLCFKSFDQDGSGFIDAHELHVALSTFGYRFSPLIAKLMIKRFDRQNQGVLAFDDFIQCCIMLHNITDAFRQLDQDRDGIITIHYEQFINICLEMFIS